MKYYKDKENAIHYYANTGESHYGAVTCVTNMNNHYEIGRRSPNSINGDYIEISKEEFMDNYNEVLYKLNCGIV